MQKWEYASLYLINNGEVIQVEHTLPRTITFNYDPSIEHPHNVHRREVATLGKEGWELMKILAYNTELEEGTLEEWIFKRPAP